MLLPCSPLRGLVAPPAAFLAVLALLLASDLLLVAGLKPANHPFSERPARGAT